VRKTSGLRKAVSGRTALLVVASSSVRETLDDVLLGEGFYVSSAFDVERARELLSSPRRKVGIVVLDIGISGAEDLLAMLCDADNHSVPVVLLAANGDRGARLGSRYGLPLLVPPLDRSVVAATVTMAFDHDVRPFVREASR
jgi:FixJ family two-component response regulator